MILVSKKDLLQQIALNTAIKENTEAVIANATAKATSVQSVAVFTAEQQKELINYKLLSQEQLDQISTELGLQVAKNGALVTTKALNTEKLKEIMTSQGVQKETQEEILQKIALASANKKAAQSAGVLNTTLNMIKAHPVIAIISILASGIAIFSQFYDTAEETDEKAEELINTFKSAKKEAKDNADTIKSISAEYKELSKGVDNFGNNISLTEDEFSRYHDIVNQIADISPELVSGWDSQDNAIVNLKDDVDALTESYKKAQLEAYNTLISGGDDFFKQSNNLRNEVWYEKFKRIFTGSNESIISVFTTNQSDVQKKELLNGLLGITSEEEFEQYLTNSIDTYGNWVYDYIKELGMTNIIGKGFDRKSSYTGDNFTSDFSALTSQVKTELLEIESELDNNTISLQTLADAYFNRFLLQDSKYENISTDVEAALSQIVNSINQDTIDAFGLNSPETMSAYVQSLLDAVTSGENGAKVSESLVELFSLDTENLSIKEQKDFIEKYIGIIAEAINEDPVELKIRLGFDDIDSLYDNYNTITTTYAKKFSPYSDFDFTHETDAYKKYQSTYEDLNEFAKNNSINTQNEIALWKKYLEESKTIESAMKKYLAEAPKIAKIDNIQHLSNIQSMESDLDKIGEIYKDVQDMETFDYSSILNNEEFATIFSGYTEEYQKFIETISDSPDDIDKCQSSFDDLVSAYINGKGFIEDVTDETKDSTIAMLEQMGVTNANEIVTRALAISKERLRLETGECVGKTYEEILAMSNLATEGSITQMVLAQLALEKKLINGTTIDTAKDVEQIYNLAQTAGASTEVLTKLAWAKKVFESTGNGSYGNFYEYQQAREFMDSIEDGSYKIKFNIDDYKVKYKSPVTSKGSEKETEKATEILDKYFDYYEKQLQAGQITYKEYVQKCNDIRDKYYNDGKITSAEYYQYLADLYEKQLEYHDKAISAVTDAIDDKIDALEKQKEDLEDYYNGLIENIQSEIDKLQKANEERERAIALQKAQYELNRALNQKIDYTYQDGQFIYKARDGAVREAQNKIDDQLFDMRIKDLENQIEDLEKALEDATETIDEQINALNEYRDKWSSISDEYEKSQNRIYAASILGANWEADVLDGRLDKLENFKNEYLRIQGELAKASVLGADPGNVSGGSGGNGGSAGSGNGNNDKGKGEEPTPKHYNTRYKVVVGGAPVYDSGNQYTAKVWMKQNAPSGTIVSYKVPVYAKGGIVGNDKSPLDSIAHSLNEDHMVAVKTGERILTPIQNSNFEKLINVSADFVKLMKPFENIMKTPDFTKYVKNGNTKNDVVMNVSVNCPNVTNESGFNYITKELTSLTTKALQFDWNA